MYYYNYNIPSQSRNMRNNYNYNNGDRFIGPSFVAPLLIGGLAGYAIGNNNNRPNYFYQYPFFIPNNSNYFNTIFYYPF